MNYTDVHIHMLWGVDDGAKTVEEAREMLEMAYTEGTRSICLTPHYHPGYFGENRESSEKAFLELKEYAAVRYPELKLYLGNELRYSPGCVEWLNHGRCRTLNGTNHVLVDFSETAKKSLIINAAHQLLNAGYRPVIAHVERYRDLGKDLRADENLKACGAVLQIDAGSLFGEWGYYAKQKSRKLLDVRLADLVCTDAHGVKGRTPTLSKAYEYVRKHCGDEYAEEVFCTNAQRLLEV